MAFERVQFAVAAPHFVFGAPLLRHVEHESLVAFDFAGGVARGEAALDGQQKRAVFAAQRDFEVAHVVVGFDFAAEGVALLGIDADLGVEVQDQQFVAAAVAQHVDEGVIAIEQLARRLGDVNALLHLLEEQAIFFFRGAPLGDVANHVNRAFLRAALLGVRGSRDHGEAAEAGVGAFGEFFVSAHGAVGTSGPLPEGVGQGGLASAAHDVGGGLCPVVPAGPDWP